MLNCIVCNICFDNKINQTICSTECRKKQKINTNKKYFDLKIKKTFNIDNIKKINSTEVFKQINGYENYYISNFGRVYSVKKQDFMKQSISKQNGYICVSICNKKHKTFTIHRLLGLYFIKNEKPNEYNIIDHIDRNRQNNNLDNLRWCDSKINNNNSANVLFRKGCIIKTNDLINGKNYEGWRVYYYIDNKKHSKRFKDETDAILFQNSL